MKTGKQSTIVRHPADSPIRVVINGIHSKSGGGVTYIRELVPRLAAFPDIEVHLFLHRNQLEQFYPIDENIRVHLFRFAQNHLATLTWEQVAVPVLTRSMGADIVFSPANYGPVFAKNHVILLRNAVSVFLVEGSLKGKVYWLGVGLATFASVLTARCALAVSEFARRELTFGLAQFIGGKVSVVPHGTSFAAPPGGRPARQSGDLLAVSDIYVQKNYHTLFRAFAILHRRYPDLNLRIAGETIDHGYMKRIRGIAEQLGLEKNIRFLGRVGIEELGHLYRECRVFVFPSLVETFGNPLLEAMATGASIACSNSAAMPEIIGNGGVLFDPRNADDMAEKIASLLDSEKLCEEVSARAVDRARTYTWENTAANIRRLFRAIVFSDAGPHQRTP